MAHETWGEIDDRKYDFKEAYCVFLDILGYRARLEEFFAGKFNLYDRVERAKTHALLGLERNLQNLPEGMKFIYFSDSLVFTAEVGKTEFSILLDYTLRFVACFSLDSLFLRGGISVGKIFQTTGDDSFLASEGLVSAYEMEKEAKFPLIEVDSKLVGKFRGVLSRYIVKSGDKLILNYARMVINECAENEDSVCAEIEELIDRKNSFSDINVREKYEWIINYYLWTIDVFQARHGKFSLEKFERFQKERSPKFVFSHLEESDFSSTQHQ